MKIKEITVFSNGDSSKISTWSNIPFFFTNTLLSKGIKVNRVDLSPSTFIDKVFRITTHYILRIIYKNTTYNYFRSFTHFIYMRLKIKKAIKKYPCTDTNIFLTYSFSSVGLTEKPTILFCDWTYDHYFKYFLERAPDFFEKLCIKREDKQIEGSDLVFSLFQSVSEYMKQYYKNENIFYLGNVINSLLESSYSDIREYKIKSNNLLFVGSKKYIEGAQSLIEAFNFLKQKYPELNLNIIGMVNTDFIYLPEDVNCYGYLDKGKNQDCELYYRLFKEAKVIINTTPKWGAFSATIEAMYFYIPVIITPYDEFTTIFGKDINFGYYCEENNSVLIQEKIENILNNTLYKDLCINSHNAVKEYTWNSYIDKLLKKIEEKINVP